MKLKFIRANYKIDFDINNEFFETLKNNITPKSKIALYCAAQFLNNLDKIKTKLITLGYEVISTKPFRTFENNQILGCNSYFDNLKLENDINCFLYIGDGNFHPYALLYAQEKLDKKIPIIVYIPNSGKTEIYAEDLIEKNLKKRKGNLLKFHVSKDIGVFISSKWGQEYFKSSLKLKNMYSEKNFYFFIGDNFNEIEMDNFPFVDVWVNSACPRIGQDDVLRHNKALINIKDIWKEK